MGRAKQITIEIAIVVGYVMLVACGIVIMLAGAIGFFDAIFGVRF